MALWTKLKDELDRAGRAAQDALDAGKLRLEAFRARQLADRAAQTLGYAVHRAREAGTPADEAAMTRLHDTLRAREDEVRRLEEALRAAEHHETTSAPANAPPTPPPDQPGA